MIILLSIPALDFDTDGLECVAVGMAGGLESAAARAVGVSYLF